MRDSGLERIRRQYVEGWDVAIANSVAGPVQRLRRIEAAARPVEAILASLNQQALHPGPDHVVAVTVEAWRDFITPLWRELSAALSIEHEAS